MEGCFAVLLFRVPTCAVSKINFTRDRQKPTLRARSLCYLISYSVNVHGRYMSMYRSTLSLPRAGGSASGTSRNNVLYAPSSPYPCICKNRNPPFPPPVPPVASTLHRPAPVSSPSRRARSDSGDCRINLFPMCLAPSCPPFPGQRGPRDPMKR